MSEDEENKQAPSQPLYQHSPTHPSRPNFSSKCPVLSGAKLEQLQKELGDASTISLRLYCALKAGPLIYWILWNGGGATTVSRFKQQAQALQDQIVMRSLAPETLVRSCPELRG
jgi:hypothetical protein